MTRPSLFAALVLALAAAALAGACGDRSEPPSFAGYAEADLVYVAAPSAGTLRSIAVKRGDPVTRGQPVAALEADAEVLAREAAEARVARAAAIQRNLQKGRRPNELRAIDQQLAQAEAALTASTSALARNRSLVDQGYLAAIRLDEFAAARDRDAARVRELQAQRALALEAARADEIAAAAADAHASQADAALARFREGQRQLAAPVDARVFDVMFRTGEWVATGAPVVALMPPHALRLRFFVPEPSLAALKVGDAVRWSCDGCPPGATATVRWVSPQAEYTPPVIYSAESRAKLVFMAEAEPGAGTALKPGQPVEVRLAGAGAAAAAPASR